MAHPPKIAKLCSELQCYIDIHCKPGDKLPAERVLCKIMGVSSRTLGIAMRKLADAHRIIRNPRGSFVIDESSIAVQADEPLTILLPCPDFSFNKDTASALSMQQIIRGALTAAKRYQRRVVTIPVTDSNNPEDINPNQLSQLNSHSMVMFSSKWFEPLFPLFRERRCRLAFLSCADYTPETLPLETDCFMVTRRNYLTGLFEQGISWLAAAGSKRILYVLCSFFSTEETCMQLFSRELKKHHVQGSLKFWKRPWNFRQCTDWLKQIYAEEKFDGLLLYTDPLGYYDPDLDFYEKTGLPTDLPLLISESALVNQAVISRHASVIYIPSLLYSLRGAEFLLSGRHGKEFTVAEYVIEPAGQYRGTGNIQGFSIF